MKWNPGHIRAEVIPDSISFHPGYACFTLRGRSKVDGQWKLYCLVHNIEKLVHHGYAS